MVTASWPIQTAMVNKVTQRRANLSTSVWIVCRKRDPVAQPGWEDPVLAKMRSILFDPREELGGKNILRYFFDLNVRGADFLWAALGPTLAAYSEHPYVKKTGGGILDVKDFLDEVRKLVLHFSLGALKGFDDLQRQAGTGTVVLDPVTQYYLLHREAFGFDPVLAGVCILYANACGKTDRELQMVWNIIAQGGKKKRGKDLRPSAHAVAERRGEAEAREKEGIGALILLDEFLTWAHGAASPDPDSARQDKGPVWYDRLKNFFQTLSQAMAGAKKSCLVVSLLATDPAKQDEVGTEILARCNAGLNRQADVQTPVDRGDFAELLRRRMFESFPKGTAECDKYVTVFWHRLQAAEPAGARIPDSKNEIMEAYPFHPDLLNRLFGKWTELR
jgi:uncharacterized protein DUF499